MRGEGSSAKGSDFSLLLYSLKFVFATLIKGSSSLIADHVGVEKLTGIDSSRNFADSLDRKIKTGSGRKGYTFKYVDIGPILNFGIPKDESARDRWPDYSLAVNDEVRVERQGASEGSCGKVVIYQRVGRGTIKCVANPLALMISPASLTSEPSGHLFG